MDSCKISTCQATPADQLPVPLKLDNVKNIQTLLNKINTLEKEVIEGLLPRVLESLASHAKNSGKPPTALIDLLLRVYFKSLLIVDRQDVKLLPKFPALNAEIQAQIVHALLFTDYNKRLKTSYLAELCQLLSDRTENTSVQFMLATFRSANLLYTKYPAARLEFSLAKFYFCLQSQSSAVRDECVTFFGKWIQREQNAASAFSTIINYWPWTNKFKFILLSAILADCRLDSMLPDRFDLQRFLLGVRLSLKYKSLFSAGQLVVRALSSQNLETFDELLIDILKHGTRLELVNLNSQWSHYIRNRSDLFKSMELDHPVENILQLDYMKDGFCSVMICTVFEKEFFAHPEIALIVDYLQDNCFEFDLDAQLYIYKFIVNHMMSTAGKLQQSLEFIIRFIRKHLFVPCSEFRNTTLNKLPLVLDIISKKSKNCDPSYILRFFKDMKEIFEFGILRSEYQPLLFNLKLFEVLLRCFESSTHKSLLKNSSMRLHQALAKMLVDEDVWSLQDEYNRILSLLFTCGEFDDVRQLIVKILIELKGRDVDGEYEMWNKLVADPSIDLCMLSAYYARLCANHMSADEHFTAKFIESCFEKIKCNSKELEEDSLKACKHGFHIFGYYNALKEIFATKNLPSVSSKCFIEETVQLVSDGVKLVLKQLNLAGTVETNASFQIIDNSLEMLVLGSSWESDAHSADRKFLLLSFWLTLKACCELATAVGFILVNVSEYDVSSRELSRKCLQTQSTILHGCRHKGAIEAAGLSLGQLVKGISRIHDSQSITYSILYDCFDILFGSVNQISTTRRGAGLSIMFHHFIKNDAQKGRPLFEHAIKILLTHVKKSRSPYHTVKDSDECHDNFDALVLHYFCVLVRDSELKDSMAEYYDDIMMSAIARIHDKEWTVRNGALQLFGALVPKIVGQKQSLSESNEFTSWEPSEITFTEFCIKLPKTCSHILQYCSESNKGRKSSSSIILFLEFLSNIEYIRKDEFDENLDIVLKYRDMFWKCLSHSCEKVRKLASKCLARSHELYEELPQFILSAIDIIFDSGNENLVHGLVLFFIHGIHKLKLESQFVTKHTVAEFCEEFREHFLRSYKRKVFSYYVKSYFIELFKLAQFSFMDKKIREILELSRTENTANAGTVNCTNFGFSLFKEKLESLENFKF